MRKLTDDMLADVSGGMVDITRIVDAIDKSMDEFMDQFNDTTDYHEMNGAGG